MTTQVILEDERKLLRDNRIVLLTSEIEIDTASEFIEDIEILRNRNKEPIRIIISSEGGNIDAGIACMRVMKEAQKDGIKIIGDVHGQAMSMAFFILQCCDERMMGDFCILMAHGITSYNSGDIRNHEAEGKLLNFWKYKFAELIASRCRKESEYSKTDYWLPIMQDNTPQYYTSKEASDIGLIDEVK